jgi:4-amino-4-deoxy-L-arabinose transferase-like glycosyltransferase
MSKFEAARSTIEGFFTASPREDSAEAAGHELPAPSRKVILGLLVALVIYVIARGLAAAVTKPLWLDELYTLTVSSQPSLGALWAVLARAMDGQPPGFYAVERVVLPLIHNKEIALRLPAILAFPCTLVCVFVFVKKRSGELIAFLSAFLLLSTILFERYAVEARPYSMVVACIAFALVCYQRLPSLFWTAMLGISLALAQAVHYYAVFAIVPFGLAEAVVLLRTRQFRWRVWLALACGCIPLVFFWPLLAHFKAYYGAHYYGYATYVATSLPSSYGAYFLTDSAFGAAVFALAVAGVIGSYLLLRPGAPSGGKTRDADVVEGTLLLALVSLPIIIFCIARILRGGMRDAYALAAVIGIAIAVGCALSLARPLVIALFALFIFSSVGVREFIFWRANHSLQLASPAAAAEEFVQKSGYADLPVVVYSGFEYVSLAHYASPAFFKRLFCLIDEEKELQYQHNDTFNRQAEIFRDYMPVQVRDFSEFTAAHPVFLLYSEEPGYALGWVPLHLNRVALSVRSVAVESNRRLYLVTMKGEPSR